MAGGKQETTSGDAQLRAAQGYLDKTGFPLEFRVARAFRRAGFRADLGRYYDDPDTDELRETDVIASRYDDESPGASTCSVSVVVECKVSEHNPWVLFVTDLWHSIPIADRFVMASRFTSRAAALARHQGIAEHPLMVPAGVPIAHGGVVAPSSSAKNGPSRPPAVRPTRAEDDHEGGGEAARRNRALYVASLQSAKAAYWWAVHRKDNSPNVTSRSVHLVIPLIVLGGTLLRAQMPDDSDSLVVESTHQAQPLMLRRRIGKGRRVTVIDVLPEMELERYIEQVASLADMIFHSR